MFSFFKSKPKPHVVGSIVTIEQLRDALGFLVVGSAPGFFAGKSRYAVVNSAALIWLAKTVRDNLHREADVTQWHPTATCTLFANEFVQVANKTYFGASWHDTNPAPAIAAGSVWFRPDGSAVDHAIGFAFTDRGVQFIDPQSPERLRILSDREQASIRFRHLL